MSALHIRLPLFPSLSLSLSAFLVAITIIHELWRNIGLV